MAARAFNLVLVAVVSAVALGSVAAQVTHGCSSTASTTVENGFFTMNGRCYSVRRKNAPGGQSDCGSKCFIGNMVCLKPAYVTAGGSVECNALIDAYLASPANEASISSPGTNALSDSCRLTHDGSSWSLIDAATPHNAGSCGTGFSNDHVTPCECVVAPVISGVTGVRASTSTVTVTGTTDTAGHVYCVVKAAGTFDSPAGVMYSGTKVTVASAGSFSVTVPNSATEGQLVARCTGENGANEASGIQSSASPAFEATSPGGTCGRGGSTCAHCSHALPHGASLASMRSAQDRSVSLTCLCRCGVGHAFPSHSR